MEKTDRSSREMAIQFLKRLGFENFEHQSETCRHDLECDKDGEHYYIEVKYREGYKSTDFGDSIIQLDKYNALKDLKNVYIINIFTDNIITFINIKDPHKVIKRICKHTSWWGGQRELKDLVSYDNKGRRYHLYP